MAEATKQERTVEKQLLDKVGEAISSIGDAKHVDQVISAIHSVAVLIFPVEPSFLSGNRSHSFLYYYNLTSVHCLVKKCAFIINFYFQFMGLFRCNETN